MLRKKGNIDDMEKFSCYEHTGKMRIFFNLEINLGEYTLLGKYRVRGNFKSLIFDFLQWINVFKDFQGGGEQFLIIIYPLDWF